MNERLQLAIAGGVVVLVLVVLAVGAVIYRDVTSDARPYNEIRQNIRKIEIGMTKEQVLEIMGKPVNPEDRWDEVFLFDDDPLASEPARCYFDADGRVTLVICDDDYRLAQGQTPPDRDTLPDTSVVSDSLAGE